MTAREQLIDSVARECDIFLGQRGLLPSPKGGQTLDPVEIVKAIDNGSLPYPNLYKEWFPGIDPKSVQGIVRLAYISVGPWWVSVD